MREGTMRQPEIDELTSEPTYKLGEAFAGEVRHFFLGYLAGCGGPREPGGEVKDLAAAVTMEFAKMLMMRSAMPTPSALRAVPNGIVGPIHRAN